MKMIVKAENENKITKLVSICEKYSFDIDISSGVRMADGKSIMGVLELNRHEPLKVSTHGGTTEDYVAFVNDLKQANLINNARKAA